MVDRFAMNSKRTKDSSTSAPTSSCNVSILSLVLLCVASTIIIIDTITIPSASAFSVNSPRPLLRAVPRQKLFIFHQGQKVLTTRGAANDDDEYTLLSSSTSTSGESSEQGPNNFPLPTASLLQQGRSTLTSVASRSVEKASRAASGISRVTQQGASKVTLAAGSAWSGLKGKVPFKGNINNDNNQNDESSAVSARVFPSTESFTSLLRKGQSDATNLLQWLDSQAKEGVSSANTQTKQLILQFTGKSDYQFGDIAKEVLRRASTLTTGASLQDVLLVLKILLTVGASITPMAKLLPVTMLLELLNVTMQWETRLGDKLLQVLAEALEERFVTALTAEELGDIAKRSLARAIAAFTGKEQYQQGDIEQTVRDIKQQQQQQQQQQQEEPEAQLRNKKEETVQDFTSTSAQQSSASTISSPKPLSLLQVGQEFEEWDRTFLEQYPDMEVVVEQSLNAAGISAHGTTLFTNGSPKMMNSKALDMRIVRELEEWDRKFENLYGS